MIFLEQWMKKHEKKEELIKNMPYLKTNCEIRQSEEGVGDNFILLCELLKGNAIPTRKQNLSGDEKEKRRKEECYEGGNVVGEFLLKNDEGERGTGVMKVNSL